MRHLVQPRLFEVKLNNSSLCRAFAVVVARQLRGVVELLISRSSFRLMKESRKFVTVLFILLCPFTNYSPRDEPKYVELN